MKKKKNNNCSGLLAKAAVLVLLSGSVFAADATVNSWDTEVVKKPGSDAVVGTLQPGMVVNAGGTKGNYTKISYKSVNGWVRSRTVVPYRDLFSNVKSVPVLSRKIVNEGGKDFLFYYNNGRFVKYNVTEKIQDAVQKVKEVTGVYPSTKNDLFLLEGTVKNDDEIHNYQLFYFTTGKTLLIGSFYGYKVSLETFQFSENSDYLAAVYLVDGSQRMVTDLVVLHVCQQKS